MPGTSGNDTLFGTSGADSISGLGGDDWLDGYGANDTLDGGDGNDTLLGGAGDDSLLGGNGDDLFLILNTNEGTDFFSGGAGLDTIEVWASNSFLRFSYFSLANNGIETIRTAQGASEVRINGTTGNDYINLTGVSLSGISAITGGIGADTIYGSSGSDTISGGSDNDSLIGGSGDDVFTFSGPSEGFDAIDGGVGSFDTIRADSSYTIIGLRIAYNIEIVDASGRAGVYILGDAGANTLSFTATSLRDCFITVEPDA